MIWNIPTRITLPQGYQVLIGRGRASWNINAAIFAGLEFYLYKGLYIGTELGLGGQSYKTLKMEYDGKTISKTTQNGQTKIEEEIIDEETTDNYRTTNFKTYI